jgi:hypothetical protein
VTSQSSVRRVVPSDMTLKLKDTPRSSLSLSKLNDTTSRRHYSEPRDLMSVVVLLIYRTTNHLKPILVLPTDSPDQKLQVVPAESNKTFH